MAANALVYLRISLVGLPFLLSGLAATGYLRGRRDTRTPLVVAILGATLNLVLEVVLIFGFGLGLTGAAVATFFSRIMLLGVGLWGAAHVHKLARMPDRAALFAGAVPFFAIGIPAILTQVATPVGNAYLTTAIAHYGDSAVAGWAVIGRLVPVAFGAIFALSGAVGPIFGQNFGARAYEPKA